MRIFHILIVYVAVQFDASLNLNTESLQKNFTALGNMTGFIKNNLPSRQGSISSEQKLMTELLWKYESSVRPIFNSSRRVEVALGLTLTQILDLDEKNQVLTTNVWLEVEWYDEKLIWKPEDYEGTDNIRIPCKRIWLPDVVLYNSAEDYTSGYMPSLAMVYNDGRVFWGPVVRFKSSCKIDITFFPFDDQICYLKLGSWAYNGDQVNINKRSNSIDLSNYVDNGEWELIGVMITRNQVVYNCCDEPFPDVMFYVRLRRRVKYYFMNIIIPCIILSFLCIAGFLLPPESGEKITLGLSVLLTITVFMLMVADKMPQTSESVSLISIYLMVVLTMSCISVLFCVYILTMHHKRGKPKRCPSALRHLAFNLVAPVLCLKLCSSGQVRESYVFSKSRKKSSYGYMAVEKNDIINLEELDERRDNVQDMEKLSVEDNIKDNETIFTGDPMLQHFQESQDSIRQLIRYMHKKHTQETIKSMYCQEWRDVAFVMDRLLFVSFLIVTIISTATILSLRPEQELTGFMEINT